MFRAPKDGVVGLRGDVPNFFQILLHLFLLVEQLLVVVQILPLTTATYPEVLTLGFDAVRAVLMDMDDLTLEVGTALFRDLYVHHIAGHAAIDEDHAVIVASYRLAFVAQICEVYTLKVGDASVLSTHNTKIPIKERAARRPPYY